jgi:hypothetical protein
LLSVLTETQHTLAGRNELVAKLKVLTILPRPDNTAMCEGVTTGSPEGKSEV